MGNHNVPYLDEEGEPLVNFDEDVRSDQDEPKQHLPDGREDAAHGREQSPTPVHSESRATKSRRRLIIKSSSTKDSDLVNFGLDDDEVDTHKDYHGDGAEMPGMAEGLRGDKGKNVGEKRRRDGEKSEKERRKKNEKEKGMKRLKVRIGGRVITRDGEANTDIEDMWNAVIGDSAEDDQEADQAMHEEKFIDDSGVGLAEQDGRDNEYFDAEEGEDDEEINNLFSIGKKKKKNERSAEEIGLKVESIMAELEVAAEEDVELNLQGKPALNKLKKLSLLNDALSKKHLQPEFLDHGILNLLKNWLEPLPDGSLPNINVRTGVLQILNDLPIDMGDNNRKQQLKRSGLGKVVMFLSKSEEETQASRKLARALVDDWSRTIFGKSTRFDEISDSEYESTLRRDSGKRAARKAVETSGQDDFTEFSCESKSGQSSSRQPVVRPQAAPMDFVVRPKSKVNPDEVRATRARQTAQDNSRARINKKLHNMKRQKKTQLQATKVSAEGRGMGRYL